MTLVVMNSPSSTVNLDDLRQVILSRCDVKQSSKNTYSIAIKRFLHFCSQHGWTDNILLKYKEHLRNLPDRSSNTKAQYLNAARITARHFYLLGYCSEDVSRSVKSFKVNPSHKRSPISEFDRRKIFRWLEQHGDARTSLIFHLLAFQGLRRMEVCSLRIEDYHATDNTLLIDSKGVDGKVLIMLHTKTAQAMSRYLSTITQSSGPLFSSPSKTGHLTTVAIHRIVQHVHRHNRVKANVHAWRKYFTSTLLEHGFDVITTSKFTRHKSIATVSIYYDRLDLKKQMPKFQSAFDRN
jgi:site-specific recombinase XerD